MQELQDRLNELDGELAIERSRKIPEVTRADFEAAIRYYAGGDCADPTYQKLIIGSFVQWVTLFDDHIEIDFFSGIDCDEPVSIPLEGEGSQVRAVTDWWR